MNSVSMIIHHITPRSGFNLSQEGLKGEGEVACILRACFGFDHVSGPLGRRGGSRSLSYSLSLSLSLSLVAIGEFLHDHSILRPEISLLLQREQQTSAQLPS